GNLTGLLLYEEGITGKWLAMLKEVAPRLARAAFIANPKTSPLVVALPITTRACRHKPFSCSAAISVATFSTQMAQNLCHSSPTKTFLHFMQFFALGYRAGRSRFARSAIGQPLPKMKLPEMAVLGR